MALVRGPPCLRVLVSDSWMIRYAASASPLGSGPGTPCTVKENIQHRRPRGLVQQLAELANAGQRHDARRAVVAAQHAKHAGASRPAPAARCCAIAPSACRARSGELSRA